MEKPFDTAALVEKLKAQGLPVAEQAAEAAVKAVFEWVDESLAIHPNALIKAIGVPALGILKPVVLEQVDKIDGQPG